MNWNQNLRSLRNGNSDRLLPLEALLCYMVTRFFSFDIA